MELTELTLNEKRLMQAIDSEPTDIEGYCSRLNWKVNFGKGVLGSLTKKGFAESHEQWNFGGFGHSGEVDAYIWNHPETEKFIIIGLTWQGQDRLEKIWEEEDEVIVLGNNFVEIDISKEEPEEEI